MSKEKTLKQKRMTPEEAELYCRKTFGSRDWWFHYQMMILDGRVDEGGAYNALEDRY